MARKNHRRSSSIVVRDSDRRLTERNPDWAAIRTRAGEYGARAREHGRAALEWSKPRARAAAAATRDAAVRGYEWTKPRAKAAAARTAELARAGYERAKPHVKRAAAATWDATKRGAAATGRAVKSGSKKLARRAGESLSAYAARENGRRALANTGAQWFLAWTDGAPIGIYRGTTLAAANAAHFRDAGYSRARVVKGRVVVPGLPAHIDPNAVKGSRFIQSSAKKLRRRTK